MERIKTDGEERKLYMALAMDIQMHIDREKSGWFADGKAEGIEEGMAKGKAEGIVEACREIALRMLQRGATVEQVAEDTGLSVEEVRQLRCAQ